MRPSLPQIGVCNYWKFVGNAGGGKGGATVPNSTRCTGNWRGKKAIIAGGVILLRARRLGDSATFRLAPRRQTPDENSLRSLRGLREGDSPSLASFGSPLKEGAGFAGTGLCVLCALCVSFFRGGARRGAEAEAEVVASA